MTHEQIVLEKSFHADFCYWEPTIVATISHDLQRRIDQMQTLICETDFLHSVDIAVPDDFICDETVTMLQTQCRYDVDYISVFPMGFTFCIHAKWDGRIQAEYVIAE